MISILCPTRGRPDNMRRMAESARDVEKLRAVMEGVCMEGV
jgi:hypothetical protein